MVKKKKITPGLNLHSILTSTLFRGEEDNTVSDDADLDAPHVPHGSSSGTHVSMHHDWIENKSICSLFFGKSQKK